MSIIDKLKKQASVSGASATSTPSSASQGGLIARLKASVAPTVAPTPQPAPAGVQGGYKPFEGYTDSGAFVGVSPQKDPTSNRPFLAYRAPGDTATTTDKTRTAPGVNPSIATTTPKSSFENPRMPESVSQRIRQDLNATPSQQLDHQLALSVGGSNAPENLKLIPTDQNQAASTLEGQLPSEVSSGAMSLFQAQNAEAKNKGLPAPWTDGQVAQSKTTAGALMNVLGKTFDVVKGFAGTVLDHAFQGVANPLNTAQGAVNTAVLKPLAFLEGVGNGILSLEDKGLNQLGLKTPAMTPLNPELSGQATTPFQALVNINDGMKRSPEDQKAYDTGNFLGWLVPYSKIAGGTKVALEGANLAPNIAKYIPAIADAVGFLGTGQVLHSPDEGSRAKQLVNDALALLLFKAGGFALRGVGLYAARGLAKILPEATQEAIGNAMKPVTDLLASKKKVPIEVLDQAVTEANSAVKQDTGMAAKDILAQHLENPEAPVEFKPQAVAGEAAAAQTPKVDLTAPKERTPAQAKQATEQVAAHTETIRTKYAAKPEFQTHLDEIKAELLDLSQAGFRIIGDNTHGGTETIGVPSTFPKWVPEDLRSMDLFQKVFGGIENVNDLKFPTNPRAVRQRELYNEILDTLDSRAGVDTSAERGAILKLYGEENKIAPRTAAAGDSSAAGGEGPGVQSPAQIADALAKTAAETRAAVSSGPSYRVEQVDFQNNMGGRPMGGVYVKNLNNGETLHRIYNDGKITQEAAVKQAQDWIKAQGGHEAPPYISPAQIADARAKTAAAVRLPELPNPNEHMVFGVAFPGAQYVATFLQKDVIDRLKLAPDMLKGVYDAGKELFTGAAPLKEKAEAITAANIMRLEQLRSAAWAVAEERRDWWTRQPESVQTSFIRTVEMGDISPQAFKDLASTVSDEMATALSELAHEIRARLDNSFKQETAAGIENAYIKDYFPHMWAEPEKARIFFESFAKSLGKPRHGAPPGERAFGSYTGHRILDLIDIGIQQGLKLVTTNPEELVLLREIDGQRVITKANLLRELEAEGLAAPQGTKGFEHFPLVDSPLGKRYALTPEAAKVFNNAFFEASLWSQKGVFGKLFRSVMALKGTFVPIKLALSAFHPIHITFIASSSDRAIVWENIIKGNMNGRDALVELAKSTSFIGQLEAGKNYGFNDGILKGLMQADVSRWWDTPLEKLTDHQRQIVQYIIEGGGSPKMSEEFLVRSRDGFKQAVADKNFIGAGIRGLPKLIEGYQKPVFESYIPALKVSSYIKGVEQLMKADPLLATDAARRMVALRKLWQSMDNRFGQMVYKNLFWNPIVKQVMQASFLSLGWNLGFVREFGGGALDLVKLTGKLSLGTLPNAVIGHSLLEPAVKNDITQKMLFMLDYNIQAALVGGLMTYAMTGKMPANMQDLFFPNTGDVNPDGSPARLNTSFYTREYFTLLEHWRKEGVVGGSISLVQNKMNPVFSTMAEIYNNRDYYGYQIRDTNSPVMDQAEQMLSYLMKNAITPISLSGAEQAAQTTGLKGKIFSFAGFNPAPKYIAETPIQSKIYAVLDRRTGGTKPLDAKPVADAKANIRRLYLAGKTADANAALEDAVKKGYISEKGRSTFVADLDIPADVRAFGALSQFPSDQEALLAQMSEEDLARYVGQANSKVKAHLSDLSPAAKQFVADLKAHKIKLDSFKRGQVI